MDDAIQQGPQDLQFPTANVRPARTPGQAIGVVASRLWVATLLCLVIALVLVPEGALDPDRAPKGARLVPIRDVASAVEWLRRNAGHAA